VLNYELLPVLTLVLTGNFFNTLQLRFLLDNKNHCIFIQTQFIYSVSTQQHVLAQWAIISLAKMGDKYTARFCLLFLPT